MLLESSVNDATIWSVTLELSIMILEASFTHIWCLLYSGFYYKYVMIVNDNSGVISKWSFKLIDDTRVIIYDRNMFIIQATGVTYDDCQLMMVICL